MQIWARECGEGLPRVKQRGASHLENVPPDSNLVQVKSNGLQKCAGDHKHFVCLGCEITQWSGLVHSCGWLMSIDLWILIEPTGSAVSPHIHNGGILSKPGQVNGAAPAFNSHCNSSYPLLSSSGMSWKETQHQASLLVNFSGLNQVEGQRNCPEGTYCIFPAIGWDFFCTAQKYIRSSCHPFTCTSLCEKDLYDWPKWGSPAFLSAVLLSLPPFSPLLCFYPSWLPSSIAHAICLYP